ncbi:trypsin-like peptidase domain-containing protein [Chromobacterium sp.]|uniref:trypsin-like peptidase domain-containing protein n=1 Tax=Chromobacterium sp. TaxID=306190 RepID=UPI0035B20B67
MTNSLFKLKLLVGALMSTTVLAQAHSRPALTTQTEVATQKMQQHGTRQALLQAGRSAQSGPYVAETTIGARGVESVKPYFSIINLPPQAYIEVSDPEQKEVYLYGQKDFGQLAAGKLFAPLSISGEYARIRVVYPEGATPRQQDAVTLEYWESPPTDTRRNISNDERELSPCVTAKNPSWNHGSLATGYMDIGRNRGSTWALGNDNFMVTNNHVVNDQQDLRNNGEVNFHYITPSCEYIEPGNVLKIKPDKLLVTGRPSGPEDYTLFTLDAFDYEHAKVKYLFGGLELDNKIPARNTALYIPQHGIIKRPDGSDSTLQSIAYKKANASCKVISNTSSISHNCDTQVGASGSPVLSQSSGKVVGVHWGTGRNGNVSATAESLWKAMQPYVSAQQNQAVIGLGTLRVTPFIIRQQQLPITGPRFTDTRTFEPLSGRWLAHEQTHSKIAAASQDIQTGKTYEIVYRVSQNINGQSHNLQQAVTGSKTLNVMYVESDNPKLPSQGPHKSWIGLKAHVDGQLVNNYLMSIYNTTPGNGNSGGGDPSTPPTAVISGPAELLQGAQGSILSAEGSTGDKLTYKWENNSQLMLLPNHDKLVVIASMNTPLGKHQVKLTVTDSKGRTETAIHTLQVKSDGAYTPPQANISSKTTVKAGETLALSAEQSTGSSLKYLWSNPHGLTFQPNNTAQKVQVTVPASAQDGQTYTIKLAVTDQLNKKHETSHTVTVKKDKDPAAPVARISGGQASYTAGQSIRLNGSSSTGYNGALNYQWTASPTLNMGQTNANTVSFTAPEVQNETVYTVTLTVKDPANGKDHRATHTMTIKPKESGGSEVPAFQRNVTYKAGDRVSNAGGVFECKPAPHTGWCTIKTDTQMRHYEPGKGINWSQAWIKK